MRAPMYDHVKVCAVLAPAPFGCADRAKAARLGQIIDAALKLHPAMDLRWLAYCLATAFWESAWTLVPRREIGLGRGHPYGIINPHTRQIYYGRGLVQTTWYGNYLKLKKLLGIDCVAHPDLLLEMQYAAPALFVGLEEGIYTGKRLAYFFNVHTEDAYHARECINGLDKAEAIAELYKTIKRALEGARVAA